MLVKANMYLIHFVTYKYQTSGCVYFLWFFSYPQGCNTHISRHDVTVGNFIFI